MKIFGMALILLSALFFAREKNRAAEDRLRILEELFRLADAMKIEISCYLRPISDIVSSFSSEMLTRLGFISDFEALGALSAYLRLESAFYVSEEEKKLFRGFFSRIGKGYADDELKLIESFSAQLFQIIKNEREKLPKEKRLSATLSCALAFAIIILLV